MLHIKRGLLIVILMCVFDCIETKTPEVLSYEDEIGDTPYNPKLDNKNFKFCDSANVLHKRALVSYTGGNRVLEKDLIENYKYLPEFKGFSGFFIVRFVVNCQNKTGRFRMEILDEKFQKIDCSEKLENHILSISKGLSKWNHALYKGKDYDCYRFITIKLKNGKIQQA